MNGSGGGDDAGGVGDDWVCASSHTGITRTPRRLRTYTLPLDGVGGESVSLDLLLLVEPDPDQGGLVDLICVAQVFCLRWGRSINAHPVCNDRSGPVSVQSTDSTPAISSHSVLAGRLQPHSTASKLR